jgi:WD40 repeat protein
VWLLDCAQLCDALAANAPSFTHALVHQARVWSWPGDRTGLLVHDVDAGSSKTRVLPIKGLHLLAVCTAGGSIHLLNTHGVNYTIRSSFTRHTQPVHALALCEIEGLIISGGVSRDLYLWDPYSPTTCDKLTGLRTGLCAVVVMAPMASVGNGSLAVSLSLDGCVCVWSIRQRTMLTGPSTPPLPTIFRPSL